MPFARPRPCRPRSIRPGTASERSAAGRDARPAAAGAAAAPPQTQVHYVMGTYLRITADGDGAAAGMAACFQEARRLERRLLALRRDQRAVAPERRRRRDMARERRTCRLLDRSLALADATDGVFNVAVGPLTALWRRPGPPGPAELASARAAPAPTRFGCAPAASPWHPEPASTSTASPRDMPSTRAPTACAPPGVSRALVSLGESSLYALGAPRGAAYWRLAVRGPDPETQVAWLGLRDVGASVSATYGGTGRRAGAVAHIIDPRSGRPLEDDAVAVVAAPSATDAEGWTKALLVWGRSGVERVRQGGAAAAVHVTAGRGPCRRRGRCRRLGHVDAVAGAAAHRRARGAAPMKVFGSSGYILSDARLDVRLVYTGFLVLVLVGMATMALFQVEAIGPGPTQIAAYFRGGERNGAMAFPKTFRELIELTHFHAFVMGVVYLVLAHLVLATSASDTVKRIAIVLAFAGLAGDVARASG